MDTIAAHFARVLAAALLLMAAQTGSAQSCDEWISHPDAVRPSPRILPGLCYDSIRDVTVLFGGAPGCLDMTDPVGETWEYDGFGWMQSMADGPSPRAGHGMAFDSARGVTVLFGGQIHQGLGSAFYSGETWQWDGSTWTLRATTGPSPRVSCGMTYDQARGVVVLFGGATDQFVQSSETWEWDGNHWTLVATDEPAAREGGALVYDPHRSRCMLVGGISGGPGDLTQHTDLWEWDGNNWTLVNSNGPILHNAVAAFDIPRNRLVVHAPDPATYYFSATWEWDGAQWTATTGKNVGRRFGLVYDEARGVTVLFGGDGWNDCARFSNDTWEWNGEVWRLQARMLPQAGSLFGMVYDASQSKLVVGGDYPFYEADTWLWNGNGWRAVFPANSPAVSSGVMAYDDDRQVTVLLGWTGVTGTGHETWEFDGFDWLKKDVAGPPGGAAWAIAYDAGRKVIILLGGPERSGGDDTWEYDGQAWIQRADTGPPPRAGHALAYDPIRARTVLFGGLTGLSDTWEWDGQTWQQIDVPGPPPRASHTMLFDPVRREVVVMGGRNGLTDYSDIWGFNGISWARQTDLPAPRQLARAAHYPGRQATVMVGGSPSSTMLERRPDSDNDGVIDVCDACPGTLRRAPVDEVGCLLPIPGDFDRDGDVDGADLDHLIGCMSGPAIPASSECGPADLDSDQDVDQSDFGLFQRCISGEQVAGAVNCAL